MNEAIDLRDMIAPKSDQLNADDLLIEPLSIEITRLTKNKGDEKQPLSIYFEGDKGKPYKPCKGMRRGMAYVWGADASIFVGRFMTLFRDATVPFGPTKPGGIRISNMSHIDEPVTFMLSISKTVRVPWTIRPMEASELQKLMARKKQTNPNERASLPQSDIYSRYHQALLMAATKEELAAAHASFKPNFAGADEATIALAKTLLSQHQDRVEGLISEEEFNAKFIEG